MPQGKLKVGVVGATGMVGIELVRLLDKSLLPIGELIPFSSGKTTKTVRFHGHDLAAPAPTTDSLRSCDLVFFVSSDEISQKFAPALADAGVWVIDDSAAFRLDPKVPLVIPEVNAGHLSRKQRLIAGPNCTMAPVAVAGFPLHRRYGVTAARISSYQAVSGAGTAALAEFFGQLRELMPALDDGQGAPVPRSPLASKLPRPAAFNVFPQVGRFDKGGNSSEENKVADELRKVWSAPRLRVSVTAVRVPVVRGHSLSTWLSFAKPVTPTAAAKLLAKAPGLVFSKNGDYPTPLSVGGENPVYAGRLRQGVDARELCLWVCADNLLKGAALNSVQIAEELLRRGWLKPR